MKSHYFILPLVLSLAACGTPEERARHDAIKRQEKLREEARDHFEEQQKRERERREDIENARREAEEDARDRAKDLAEKRADQEKKDAEFHAYLEEYARALGKKPSQLSPEERMRIYEKFH